MAADRVGPGVLVPYGVVLVPPVSPVPEAVVVASELEAEGPELAGADPVAEEPVVGDCPELAKVSDELKADEVPVVDVWVSEAEVSDAEPERDDEVEADSEAGSEANDELEPEELLDLEMMLVV
ncbi:hypothetical protein DHEL01_v211337 [Diaporthe helianthi]|uniref:Uncharacterized protein n=1 Tax=Diaporthe helianthi TaxID=158607 RepID=A0A2P5HJ40_DIAHE|nr:hypothetical protein DHEL01_v211337 [Diaporthe helianthi]